MPRTRPLEETLRRSTDKRGPDECWPWTGSKNHKGYGRIVRQRVGQRTLYFKASCVAWELAHGRSFPAGLLALHSCDNPGCVNPEHIWPGTPKQNTGDMIAKGRARFNPDPKARAEKVIRLRKQRRTASKFNTAWNQYLAAVEGLSAGQP